MSGRTPYIAASWKAGVEVGSPAHIGAIWYPRRWISRARNGTRPRAIASSRTVRERPSICTISRRRWPGTGGAPSRSRRIRRSNQPCRPRTRASIGMDPYCSICSPMDHSVVAAVRDFVETEVRPVAAELEHQDAYPHDLVARMRELGLFGALVPSAYGGLGLDVRTYARVIEELCRGWMSLAGVINSHTMAALIVLNHGTAPQRERFLPRFARGEARGGLEATEPPPRTDARAIRTVATRRGDEYLIR